MESQSSAFNPFQQHENCFYVALGRLLGIDSRTLSLWTGKSELETEKIGMPVAEQHKVIDICRTYTRVNYVYINLQDFDYLDDYDAVNDPSPSIAKVLELAQRHNLSGLCYAVEFYFDQEELGHFVNVQRAVPEEWDPDTNRPVNPRYRPEDWELKDFQWQHGHGQAEDHWRTGTVRRIIGRCSTSPETVYGDNSALQAMRARGQIAGSWRPEPTVAWDSETKRWKFDVYHHGHWGMGFCSQECQSESRPPQWRYMDLKDSLAEWEFSFDGQTWIIPRFTKCNMANGIEGPCVIYSDS